MYEYMRGLHQQFFKEPDFPELRQEIDEIHQALTEGKPKPERRSLLKLVDLEAELRDELRLRTRSSISAERKPLNGSSRTPRKNTRCVIRNTEAWLR